MYDSKNVFDNMTLSLKLVFGALLSTQIGWLMF